MTKQEALREINETQDFYVSKLADVITGKDRSFGELIEYNFTSPTGTGKTVMLAKLFNSLPESEYFFVVTSLSRGQLKVQIRNSLKRFCKQENYVVWGLNDFTKTTRLQEEEILSVLPADRKIVWIRDEGHIATNRWQTVLRQKAWRIINVSATNKTTNGIQCNFTHTMMLRTVSQNSGTPEDALDQLVEVKKTHSGVVGYNPCALFRLLYDSNLDRVIKACEQRGLKFINITDESFDMEDLCRDDNPYDVIINKFKITEGIDLRRCHVIYMDNKPSNEATTIQVIGRARRNALFWRRDIDIMDECNRTLLEQTRQCFVYYNIPETEVAENDMGELAYSLCDTVSVEALRSNIAITVVNGQLANGLHIIELEGCTGSYLITKEPRLGVNVVDNPNYYQTVKRIRDGYVIDLSDRNFNIKKIRLKREALYLFETSPDDAYGRIRDSLKARFFLAKEYIKKHPNEAPSMDMKYWDSFLDANGDRQEIEWQKWDTFRRYLVNNAPHVYSALYSQRDEFSKEELNAAAEYAKLDRVRVIREKINIFSGDGHFSVFKTLNPSLVPYIDSFDVLLSSLVGERLDSEPNIFPKPDGQFLVANHPQSHFLISHGISSLAALKKRVSACKNMLYGCSISYWEKAIASVDSLSELNEYDAKSVSFAQLNDLLNLGIDKETALQCDKGLDSIIRVPGTTNIRLKQFNPKTKRYESAQNVRHILYRPSLSLLPVPHETIWNDFEIAAIGPDTMKYFNKRYIEDTAVTSKIAKFSKLNSFIAKTYDPILKDCSSQYYRTDNDYGFDKKCNSCLGFCVEYYAKIKLFGSRAYFAFLERACSEAKTIWINDAIRVRAAMLAYREAMKACYGSGASALIPTISAESLLSSKYDSFVKKVVELGNIAAAFVLENVYGGQINPEAPRYDPNLSVNHISALCDFITEDTILDLKCTSAITEKHVKQILAYHYLASKRSDLHIKKLIVFDAPTQRSLIINL